MAEVKKNTFLMFCDWKPIIDGMSDEQVGHIIKGLFCELTGGEYTFTNETAPIANFMLEQIKKSNNKYEATCKRKSEAAKKRAEKAKHSNTFESIQKHSNTLGDNENDNEYDNENDNENENDINTNTKDISINNSFFSTVTSIEKKIKPPTPQEVDDFFYFELVNEGCCIDIDEPKDFYSYNTLNNWMYKNKSIVSNWKVFARNWHRLHEKKAGEL